MRSHTVIIILSLGLLPHIGCSRDGSADPPPTSTASVSTAAPPEDLFGTTAGEAREEAALVDELARHLATELALDPGRAERVRAAIAASWSGVREEISRRAAANEELSEETVSLLLEERQRALDLELAALLTPAERTAFAELGGRLEEVQ